MGGEGSGRQKESITTCDVLMSEDDFKQSLISKTVKDYNIGLDTLMSIIKGEVSDYVFDSKNGEMIDRPPALGDRLRAGKVWYEMTLAKVGSDKKIVDVPQNGNVFDLLNTMKEIGEKVER